MDSTRTAKFVSLKKENVLSDNFTSLASPSDHSYFLSASVDKTIGLWEGHDENVCDISFRNTIN
jgi:hypothetical protein